MSEYQKLIVLTIDVHTDYIISIQIYHLIANNQLFYPCFMIMQNKYICVWNVQCVLHLDEELSISWVIFIHFQYEETKFTFKFISYDIKWIILRWIDGFCYTFNIVNIININLKFLCFKINVNTILMRWYQQFRLVVIWLEKLWLLIKSIQKPKH